MERIQNITVVAYYTVYSVIREVLRTLTPSLSCVCEVSLAGLMHLCLCTADSAKLLRASISREHSSVHSKSRDSFSTEVVRQMSEVQDRAFSTTAK